MIGRRGNPYRTACCDWGAFDNKGDERICADHRAQLLDFLDWLKNPGRRVEV